MGGLLGERPPNAGDQLVGQPRVHLVAQGVAYQMIARPAFLQLVVAKRALEGLGLRSAIELAVDQHRDTVSDLLVHALPRPFIQTA